MDGFTTAARDEHEVASTEAILEILLTLNILIGPTLTFINMSDPADVYAYQATVNISNTLFGTYQKKSHEYIF
ncbi:Protein of unknown function [Bacillus mycoides]|uniref:Uncharacterized protein n=1 Tax=Bacillus mycoides TaxID=1405 RepID=A0A1G4ERM7_BACMY|nr:Protein of unknown function [Bacillus mycoides]